METLTFGAFVGVNGPYQDTFGDCMGDISQDAEEIQVHCH